MAYSSLHNHTYYSIQDGFASPKEYLDKAKELNLKAIAITEHGNLYSAPYVHKLKKDYPDLKIIYGFEAYECFDHKEKDPENKYFHLVILAKNEAGRVAVNKLITAGEFEGKYYKPRIDIEMIKPYADDLIVTTACMASKLHKEESFDQCIKYINEYKSIFNRGNFFLEMQSHSSEEQAGYNKKILQLAQYTNTPFIITTDSHAVTKEQLKYQGLFVQIAQDADTTNENYEGCYLQSEEEIHDIMDKQIGREYVNIGLNRTNELANMCEDVQMPFGKPKLPHFPIPDGYTQRSYIEELLKNGWHKREFDKLSMEEQQIRKERVEYELSVIDNMGFIGYFLIVWDLMAWGRKNNVLFGDGGRGSAAGSMVCFLLEITGIDPVKYGLIFERFLNPERVGMPDIDIDCYPREKIIGYLQDRYGKMSVCQIANFSTISPTVAIQDTARILDRDKKRFEQFNQTIGTKTAREISKLFNYPTWQECVDQNKNMIENYSDILYEELFEVAEQLSGRVRHCAIHAGGVGVVDGEVSDILPMRLTSANEQVVGADKVIAEECTIVKIDLLGLNNLKIIQETLELSGLSHEKIIPTNDDFMNDKQSYELLGNGETDSVFQLESKGMTDLCVKIKPKNLSDLSDILALFRPDVMQAGMLDDYINRKMGKESIEYIHPDMKKILGRTYGVQIYQEQSMEITKVFGGRSMSGADNLRKIIGKKKVEQVKPEIAKLRQEIIDNGYDKTVSDYICNIMEGYGSYSFNLSHSMGYSVISLQTAYLKAHYPVEFYAATLNGCEGETGKINKKIVAAQNFGITVLCPHINKSQAKFSVFDGKILFGLAAISGLGMTVVEKIVQERITNGDFTGVLDVHKRCPDLTTKQMVNLIKSGAFGQNKKVLLRKFLKYVVTEKENIVEYKPYKPVKTTPSLLVLKTEWEIESSDKEERLRLYNEKRKELHETVNYEKWLFDQKEKNRKEYAVLCEKYCDNELYYEFEAISAFLTYNPLKEIYRYINRPFDIVNVGQEFFDVGIISRVTKKKDRNKRTYCYLDLYSYTGIIEGVCFSSTYDKYMNIIAKGERVAIFGERSTDTTFVVRDIETIDNWLRRCNISSN